MKSDNPAIETFLAQVEEAARAGSTIGDGVPADAARAAVRSLSADLFELAELTRELLAEQGGAFARTMMMAIAARLEPEHAVQAAKVHTVSVSIGSGRATVIDVRMTIGDRETPV